MIVKMKFLSITGPKSDIDRVTNLYLSKYEIQLEHAITELKTVDNLQPFVEINPYKDPLAKAEQFVDYLKDSTVTPDMSQTEDEIFSIIRDANHDYMELQEKKNQLKTKREECREKLKIIEPFKPLDFDLHRILSYRFIKFRFGRVPLDYYHKLEKYIYEDLGVLFIEGARDTNYVYGVYFVSSREASKIDPIFKSLHYETIYLQDEYEGSPAEAYRNLEREIAQIGVDLEHIDDEVADMLKTRSAKLIGARDRLRELSRNFEVRKLAACVEDKHEDYYILCGWMSKEDIKAFIHEIKDDEKIFVVVEDDHENYFGEPPTKLQNPKVFKPFEMFIHMYGLPAHNEMDPTIFVALTYTFIFGVMFGDVGQGLCMFIGGALLYKFKKIALAGIISTAGVFSTFFGFMFGSVFGFENIIEATWMRPISQMTTLPFIGKLNTVFIVAVAFGMGIILVSMIFHIINAFKAHDTENTWFDANGVAGLIFYGSIVATVVLFMTGHHLPGIIILVFMFGLPLILILFKEPLTRKIEKRADKMEESKGMFLVQGFFELFETLLSYFSNTLSFVRIGAFAVSHAAMMEVVLMLAGAEGGNPNWVVVILGNLFVCGMEGLIVGIQVLRLEYYEMFSRFYKGTGREFKPYANKQKDKKH